MQIKNFSSLRQFFPVFRKIGESNNSINRSISESLNPEMIIALDNAATTQKPQQVIDRIADYYTYENASVHRGLYAKAEHATQLYEQARAEIANYIGAYPDEIVFVRGATEGINFVAATWATKNLVKGDEIILSELEHNANVLPWLHLVETLGIKVRFIPITEAGDLDYQAFQNLINEKTKLVSITHRANSIGVRVNLDLIINKAKENNIAVLVDAAQTVSHEKIDVSKMKPDFLVFSAHKILGPTGIGALYVSRAIQETTPPYQFGGGMVLRMDTPTISWLKAPHKYEAGTPAIASALGFAEGIRFINEHIDFDLLNIHQKKLSSIVISGLQTIKNIKILGPVDRLVDSPIISFHSTVFHSHDIAAYLDQFNIAVRAGNQCAQTLYNKLKIPGSVRISTYFYNTADEIEFLLSKLEELFGK